MRTGKPGVQGDYNMSDHEPKTPSVEAKTLYAVVNMASRNFQSPLVIINEQYGPERSQVGTEPAIYRDLEAAEAQYQMAGEAFGFGHLEIVQLDVTPIDADADVDD